jgi:hypothetical protein
MKRLAVCGLAASLALAWAGACVPEDIIVAEQQAPPADPPPSDDAGPPLDSEPSDDQPLAGPCTSNDDCELDEFCNKRGCSNAVGTCKRRPVSCNAEQKPVCGCDKLTYFNDCLRQAAGVNLARNSECQDPWICGTPFDFQCPSEAYCAIVVPPNVMSCPTEGRGTCWVLPSECDEDDLGPNRYRRCGDFDAECQGLCQSIRDVAPFVRAQRCSQ